MKAFDCRATGRLLQEFHDQELCVSDEIGVHRHLEGCHECRLSLRELRSVGAVLQATPRAGARLTNEEAAAFTAAVVSRGRAEREASVSQRVRVLFDDWHLVYAGVGAAAATLACVVAVLTMTRLATDERPDSLAAMVGFLATPGTTGNPAAIDDEMQTRWHARLHQANESAAQDAVFALSAVVIHEGRLRSIEHARGVGRDGTAVGDDAQLIEELLDGLSRARFANEMGAQPPASGMVWLVTRTTVRATKTPALDLPSPAGKRQADAPSGAPLAGPVRV
jgi:hypothetical protein